MSVTQFRSAPAGARSRVDSGKGILSGVSVITEGPALGHNIWIDAKTVQQVKGCASQFSGGVKVKMNHGTGVESIVGVLKAFRVEGPKLLGDLHLLKTHTDFAKIVEMATNMPESFGLSIAFSGEVEEVNGKRTARCLELYSIDIVDSPAANPSGLFSIPKLTTFEKYQEKRPVMDRAAWDKLTVKQQAAFITQHKGRLVNKLEAGETAFSFPAPETLTRKEFFALKPDMQRKFLADGNKLVD